NLLFSVNYKYVAIGWRIFDREPTNITIPEGWLRFLRRSSANKINRCGEGNYLPPLGNLPQRTILHSRRKQLGGGAEFGVLLGLLGLEAGQFYFVFGGDGLHGGEQGVFLAAPGFQRGDLGFDRLEIDKPAFEDGLGHLFEGLIDLVVELDFVRDR